VAAGLENQSSDDESGVGVGSSALRI